MSEIVSVKITLKEHRSGTTYKPVDFIIKKDGVAVDLTSSAILMQFRETETGAVVQEFSLANNKLVIVSAVNGIFQLNPGIITVTKSSRLSADIKITLNSGEVINYIDIDQFFRLGFTR